MFTDIRHWAKALLDRAEERGFDVAPRVVRFPRDTENSVKPAVATMDIATLMDEPLRSDLLAGLSGVGAL